jgi:hypothetical protein
MASTADMFLSSICGGFVSDTLFFFRPQEGIFWIYCAFGGFFETHLRKFSWRKPCFFLEHCLAPLHLLISSSSLNDIRLQSRPMNKTFLLFLQCDLRPSPGGRCRHGRVYLGRDRSSRSRGVCPQADDNPRVRRALKRLGLAIGKSGGKSAELLIDIPPCGMR